MIEAQALPSQIHALPLLPLKCTVLFPGTAVPIEMQTTESELIQACARERRPLLAAQIRPGRHDADAPVFPVGCVCEIVHLEQRSDTSHALLLQGIQRAHLIEELPAGPAYRRFKARLVPKPSAHSLKEVQPELARLHSAITQLEACVRTEDKQLVEVLHAVRCPVQLLDTLSAILVPNSIRQQELLAQPSLRKRLDSLLQAICRAMLRFGRPPSHLRGN